MTAPARQGRPAGTARPRHRSGPVLGLLTTLVALWLGLTAPAVSPVAPPPPAAVQVVDAAVPGGAPGVPGPGPAQAGGGVPR